MKQKITVYDFTPDDLKGLIECATEQAVSKAMEKSRRDFQRKETFLSRQETADFMQISLVTLNKLTKKRIFKPYYVGRKVCYKLSEVQHAIENGHGNLSKRRWGRDKSE